MRSFFKALTARKTKEREEVGFDESASCACSRNCSTKTRLRSGEGQLGHGIFGRKKTSMRFSSYSIWEKTNRYIRCVYVYMEKPWFMFWENVPHMALWTCLPMSKAKTSTQSSTKEFFKEPPSHRNPHPQAIVRATKHKEDWTESIEEKQKTGKGHSSETQPHANNIPHILPVSIPLVVVPVARAAGWARGNCGSPRRIFRSKRKAGTFGCRSKPITILL